MPFSLYITVWTTACLIALALYAKAPQAFAISRPEYWRFLIQPWKVVTFVIATAGLTIVSPYTGDPTWDYTDALFMSILAYATAPWVVGVFYNLFRRTASLKEGYVAFCVWMFSASWSYDLYILLRDGMYPMTWFYNIFASSVLYWSAGLLWNLEYYPDRGVIFSFMREGWPAPVEGGRFRKLIWMALPFMLLVILGVLSFIIPFMKSGR